MPDNVTLPGTGSVVEALAVAVASGQVDADPEAVAYAESLNA